MPGGGEPEARLAAAARADQCQEPRALEEVEHLPQLARSPDEARQLHRERRWLERADALACEQLAVERAGCLIRLGGELHAERIAEPVELRERVLTAAERDVELHQLAMRGFVQRRGGERALQRVHGVVGLLPFGELEAERPVQLPQRGPSRVRPALVAVFGQQLAAVQLACFARFGGSVLESVDVARDPL